MGAVFEQILKMQFAHGQKTGGKSPPPPQPNIINGRVCACLRIKATFLELLKTLQGVILYVYWVDTALDRDM
jgi:hypothetical protein